MTGDVCHTELSDVHRVLRSLVKIDDYETSKRYRHFGSNTKWRSPGQARYQASSGEMDALTWLFRSSDVSSDNFQGTKLHGMWGIPWHVKYNLKIPLSVHCNLRTRCQAFLDIGLCYLPTQFVIASTLHRQGFSSRPPHDATATNVSLVNQHLSRIGIFDISLLSKEIQIIAASWARVSEAQLKRGLDKKMVEFLTLASSFHGGS